MTSHPPLVDHLIGLIQAQGPIPLSDYMATCLYHPAHGYYVTGAPLGAKGDFITAPEVSQMFGELIGLWCLQTWEDMGAPEKFVLAELGPGRGTLMSDLMRAARLNPKFGQAAQIHLVESNTYLQTQQASALQRFGHLTWHKRFADLPDGPMILIANEFFDCLPVRQFVRQDDHWHERMVGLEGQNQLKLVLSPDPVPIEKTDILRKSAFDPSRRELTLAPQDEGLGRKPFLDSEEDRRSVSKDQEMAGPNSTLRSPTMPGVKDGDVMELCPQAISLTGELTQRLAQDMGRALIIDYGYGARYGDTLQAVKDHDYVDILHTPGQADLTAHVNFASLATIAQDAGMRVQGPIPQSEFLGHLGLPIRAALLKKSATPEQATQIDQAAHRLTAEDQMGTLFKALCLSHPALPPAPGFDIE